MAERSALTFIETSSPLSTLQPENIFPSTVITAAPYLALAVLCSRARIALLINSSSLVRPSSPMACMPL